MSTTQETKPTKKDLQFLLDRKAINPETREIDFIASTAAYDRVGDSIDQNGWELGNYLKNPVVLYGHDYSGFPIGKASRIEVRSGQLVIRIQFATREQNPDAEVAYQLAMGGFLSAVSVGFIPKEWSYRNETDGRPSGMDITRAELLEVSVVPVPCHPDAIVQARGLGFKSEELEKFLKATKPDEVLSTEQQIELARKNIENARRAKAEATPKEQPDNVTTPEPATTTPETQETDVVGQETEVVVSETQEAQETDSPEPAGDEPEGAKSLTVTLRAEDLKAVLAEEIERLKGEFAAELKAGRVLSRKNEQLLRDAHTMHDEACRKIRDVLDQLGETPDPDVDEEPKAAEPAHEIAATPQTFSAKDFLGAIETAATVAAARTTGRP